jgi:hypothetical protein
MKIKEYKCGCGHDEFFFADKGNQKGIYCSYCGKWLKWADKNEQNLRMKQVSVLDKIRAEIKSKKFGLTDTEDGRRIQSDIHAGFDGGIECALQIIDKYKASSTGEEEEL